MVYVFQTNLFARLTVARGGSLVVCAFVIGVLLSVSSARGLSCTWYDKDYYRTSPGIDPQGPSSGVHRALRGGSWVRHGRLCRSASRHSISYTFRSVARGFRIVGQESVED